MSVKRHGAVPRAGKLLVALCVLVLGLAAGWRVYPGLMRHLEDDRAAAARQELIPGIDASLASLGSHRGAQVFVRIFKEERKLELWVDGGDTFELFREYPICRYSGELGPKKKEGDLQAPEGIYAVSRGQLNPHSHYHLAFNLGYPNAFERGQGWTGSALMVHGDCVSIGCYAMGDAAIEEIYTLIEAALDGGHEAVWVQALPFALTPERIELVADPALREHWARLLPAYEFFERHHRPPALIIDASGYHVDGSSPRHRKSVR